MSELDAKSGATLRGGGLHVDATSGASVLAEDADFDAVSAATRWSMGAKRDKQVPLPGQSMDAARESGRLVDDAASICAQNHGASPSQPLYSDPALDATSGATPGVATACRDFGVATLEEAMSKFNCKKPGTH